MHDEVVKRRQWLTDEQFLGLLGATNLIPGANSTEMAIHIGYVHAGWLLLRYKVNSTWLIAAGAIAGFLFFLVR
jgi:chromate transporter